MARIAFVQHTFMEYLGIMYLSSLLRTNGNETEIFIDTNIKRLAIEIKKFNPDIVGFSCLTGMQDISLKAATAIKSCLKTITFFGGPHPTFFPEIIEEPAVDIICRGEGEGAFLDLVKAVKLGGDIVNIPNCWIKKEGQVIKNEVRPLIVDLDSLPYPDRRLYYSKYPFMNHSQKVFIAGRGCPYKCTYCFNEPMQELYKGKGKYVRLRSVGNVISEIEEVCKRYNTKTVYMLDDTFILNRLWLFEFLERYQLKINLPFICLIRADLVDEETVRRLKSANCHSVFFGVESGNETIRHLILGKEITDRQIIETAAFLKKYKIKFRTYNMLGIPGESLEDALRTVALNVAIKTDYPWSSILQPYPKTAIRTYAQKYGLLKTEVRSRYFFKDSVLNLPNIKEFTNLQKLFYWSVKFPSFKPLIKKLIRLPPNLIFIILFLIGYTYSYYRSERLRFKEVLQIGWLNISSFLFS